MAGKLPYVAQPGSIVKVLQKIKEARTPERFTTDFLETKLGCRGGAYNQFIPFGKKCGLLNADGTPTEVYKQFRNSHTSRLAVGQALRTGYHEIFERNEQAHALPDEQFKGLVVEITGLEAKDRVAQLICQTFRKLKALADFSGSTPDAPSSDSDEGDKAGVVSSPPREDLPERDLDLRLSYAINLVLPKTDDPAVFNAIFRALRDNLLRK